MEVALVTAYTGKEQRCIVDLLNALMPYDPDVKVIQATKASFLVDSNLNPNAVLSYLKLSPPRCAAKVYPIHIVTAAELEKLVHSVAEYITLRRTLFQGKKFYAECTVRSGRFPCREAEIGIGIALRGIMLVNFDDPDYIIHVNVVRDKAYVSVLHPMQEKLSENPPR